MVRVVIADDHKLVRDAWTMLLSRNPEIIVEAVCENGKEVVEICRTQHPDVVLMDINMSPVNGVEATIAIREFSSVIKVIGISIHSDSPYITALMSAGANGYVTKNSSVEEMMKAIFTVKAGKQYICEEITGSLRDRYR